MKNVYVLATLVVMFGGVLVGCTKNKSTDNKPMPKSLQVETQMEDTSAKDMKESDAKEMKEENSTDKAAGDSLRVNRYTLDVAESSMGWHGEKITGKGHDGTMKIKSGELIYDGKNLVSGEFVIDMTAMLEGGKVSGVVKHLSGEDFFNVEKYPTSKLVITGSDKLDNGDLKLSGDLTIKDKTNSITFVAKITEDGDKLTAKALFTIDRTKWDVRYGSDKFFDNLGDNVIKDEISYTLEIIAKK